MKNKKNPISPTVTKKFPTPSRPPAAAILEIFTIGSQLMKPLCLYII
jgi:hypothetical protein